VLHVSRNACLCVKERDTHCVAVYCSILQCNAVCCSATQFVAVCCTGLQCKAVCCSAMQFVAAHAALSEIYSYIHIHIDLSLCMFIFMFSSGFPLVSNTRFLLCPFCHEQVGANVLLSRVRCVSVAVCCGVL